MTLRFLRRALCLAIPFLVCAMAVCTAVAAVDFETYFADGALRVDIVHSGTVSQQAISVRQIVREPQWSGPHTNLLPRRDLGQYRFDVTDTASGELIYRRGYSSLYGEWTTTEEAKTVRRAFEETLEMPYPKAPVVLTIFARNKQGSMGEIFSVAIDPASHLIGRSPTPTQAEAEVIDLQVTGDPSQKVDILVLGDGYLYTQKDKFLGDLDHFMENFFDAEPFERRWEDFNVRAVFVASNQSGVDEPRKGIFCDTPFGMMFNTFDLPRYCMTEELWTIHDYAASVPHDAILLMANTSRYGGGAIYNFYTGFVSDNEFDDYVTVHEFGHGFAGLGDEYYSSAVAYNEFYPKGVEPWEPNLTALLDPEHLKWKQFIEAGTPVPTPEDDARYANKVGAFEGAGYAAKDLYRPAKDCKMFSKGNRPFCKVCEAAVNEMIDFYTGH